MSQLGLSRGAKLGRRLLLLSALLVGGAATEALAGRLLTLAEARSLAVTGASVVQKAAHTDESSAAQLLQGYLQFLPNLVASANYGDYRGTTYGWVPKPSTTVGSSTGAAYQLSSSLNIFSGLGDYHSLKAVMAKRAATGLQLAWARQQIVIDVTQAYMQVILDERLLAIARKAFETSKHREELLREQTRLGVKDIANLYTQEAQTAADEAALLTAQNRHGLDRRRLLQRLRLEGEGFEFQDPTLGTKPPAEATLPDAELIRRALARRPDLAAAAALSQAAEQQVGAARSGYFPKIDLVASLNGLGRQLDSQSVNGIDQGPFQQDSLIKQVGANRSYSVALSLSWNLFDRGVTHAALAKAAADAANGQLEADDLRMQVLSDVRQAREDFLAAQGRRKAAERGLMAANRSYARTQVRYEAGAATFLDLLNAQLAQVQALSAAAQAQIDAGMLGLVLSHVSGGGQASDA